jgi:hypothetical protein
MIILAQSVDIAGGPARFASGGMPQNEILITPFQQ